MDHVWLTLDVGHGVEMRASLNTVSRRNRDAGFEPRVRVGVLLSTYEELPEPGVFEAGALDYAGHEQHANIFYVKVLRPGANGEVLLRRKNKHAPSWRKSGATFTRATISASIKSIPAVRVAPCRRTSPDATAH